MSKLNHVIVQPSAQEIEERCSLAIAQFELWTQIWRDNPDLVKKAGRRVEELMMPLVDVQRLYAETW
jgi:hypothetical protein